ncbi:hypothetical protein SAMN05661107_2435 [Maritimibacter sp. HL-12]|nr:hypothetical protein SAMN05661107_2435 [Maritimibacter sp. HL-12]
MDRDQTAQEPLRVTIQDLRDARYCLAGVRPWFRRHGFEWQDFLDHGIEADRLRATEDALVLPVIRAAQARAQAAALQAPAGAVATTGAPRG